MDIPGVDYSVSDEDHIVMNVVLHQINQKFRRNCKISSKSDAMFLMRLHFRCAYSVIILENKIILCSKHTRADVIYA